MNITIVDPKATETHQKFAQVILKQRGKLDNLALFIYLGIGLLLISYDLLNYNDCTIKLTTGLLKEKLMSNELECINLHLSLGVGIGFCYLCLAWLYGVSRTKEKTSLQTWKNYKNLHGNSNTRTVIVDDIGIQAFGELFRFEYKWELPKHFIRFEDYIAIYTEDFSLLCCVINCNLIAKDSKEELLTFLEKNLQEEKIKQLRK